MNTSTAITIKPSPARSKRVLVELDAERFERLAAGLGLFQKEFLDSISRAELEITKGKTHRLKGLRDLRRSS